MTHTVSPKVRDLFGVVVVFATAVAIWVAVSSLASLIFGAGYSIQSHTFRAVSTGVLVILMTLAATRALRRMKAPSSGLRPTRQSLPLMGMGGLAYLVPFVVASIVVLGLAAASFELEGTWLELVAQIATVMILVLLFEAVPEELVFRGLIFSALQRLVPLWATVITQAVLFCLFGFMIGAVQTLDRLVLFALFSLALGVVRASTGSVYPAIGFHLVFQTVTQVALSEQWTALTLHDPERWYSDVAYGLAPLIVGPLLVVATMRLSRRRQRQAPPA